MNKKSKSKSKTKASATRRKIKQVGCSLKGGKCMKGGDAYNVMPASKIYPLEDYTVDVQRASINAGALPKQLGGRRQGGRPFRKYSRKYYKKMNGGNIYSYFNFANQVDLTTQNQIHNRFAPFYV